MSRTQSKKRKGADGEQEIVGTKPYVEPQDRIRLQTFADKFKANPAFDKVPDWKVSSMALLSGTAQAALDRLELGSPLPQAPRRRVGNLRSRRPDAGAQGMAVRRRPGIRSARRLTSIEYGSDR